MNIVSRKTALIALSTLLASAAPTALQAQQAGSSYQDQITVLGQIPADLSGMPEGPEIEGIISARSANGMQVTTDNGTNSVIGLSDGTEIKGSGGFLGLNKEKITRRSLLAGLPVTVETVQWGGGLVASKVKYKTSDMETAAMIHGGTAQQFAEHDAAIQQNAAATEALRGRVADIDQYNIKGTTNVYFDTGKWNLTPAGEAELCAAAQQAEAMDNALLLVVGYTDSVGDEDYNQVLSERRAARVVNYLQQYCGWKPWRMLTPTGMAEADPAADNTTEAGKAQNRRVSVNVLVSKAVDTDTSGV
tara:strand:+ start:278 stop:1189 length:912 start_codon:yes stop_codon:yes gene_type:complete